MHDVVAQQATVSLAGRSTQAVATPDRRRPTNQTQQTSARVHERREVASSPSIYAPRYFGAWGSAKILSGCCTSRHIEAISDGSCCTSRLSFAGYQLTRKPHECYGCCNQTVAANYHLQGEMDHTTWEKYHETLEKRAQQPCAAARDRENTPSDRPMLC